MFRVHSIKTISNVARANKMKLHQFSTTTIYSWGDSSNGSCGHKRFDDVTMAPRRLVNSKIYKTVAAGQGYTLALDGDGNMFGWGKGPSSEFDSKVPFPIPTDTKISKVFAGPKHAACIDVNGDMYTWGKQKSGWFSGGGQLGHGEKENDITRPKLLTSLKDYGAKIASVACGAEHTLIVTDDGEVLSCGVGEYGRLGGGSSEDTYIPSSLDSLLSNDVHIIQAAAGTNHSMALSKEGHVYSWGRNDAGQLGFADTYIDIYSMEEFPRKIDTSAFDEEKVIQIAACSCRSAAVTEKGSLYVWGRKQNHYPTKVDFEDGVRVKSVELGRDDSDRHVAFVTVDLPGDNSESKSQLYKYGHFKSNMLGEEENAGPTSNPVPSSVSSLEGRNIVNISAGVGHVVAVVTAE